MANKTHPRNSCFLACFGFSDTKKPPENQKTFYPGGQHKSKSMFRLSLMRKSRTKTVPVDNRNPDKAEPADRKSNTSKLIKKKSDIKLMISSKPRSKPSRESSKAEQLVASSNQAAAGDKPEETTLQGPPEQPNIIIGNSKLSAPTTTGSSSSLPGSPVAKPKPKKHATKLSHTVSLPAAEGNKRVGNPRVHARINSKKQLQRKNNADEVVEKFDPLIGMSIIIVSLIIMVVWGRLCAILCTSAWFYFCPRFRTANINNNGTSVATSNDLDFNSEANKKKVVLEGLLERNHRLTK